MRVSIATQRLMAGALAVAVTLSAGGCLVISQFTLAAELRRGNRPDFTAAAPPEVANALYEQVAERLLLHGITVQKGRFGASMQVESMNDGPVSLVLTVRDGKVQPRSQPE